MVPVQFASSPADKAIDSQEFKGLPEIRKYFRTDFINLPAVISSRSKRLKPPDRGGKKRIQRRFRRAILSRERITPEEARRLTEK
jgi:hypothetical protein